MVTLPAILTIVPAQLPAETEAATAGKPKLVVLLIAATVPQEFAVLTAATMMTILQSAILLITQTTAAHGELLAEIMLA